MLSRIRNLLTRIVFHRDNGQRFIDVFTEYGFCRIYPDYKTVSWERCGVYPYLYDNCLNDVKNSLWEAMKRPIRKNGFYYDPWLKVWFQRKGFLKFVIVKNCKLPPDRRP